MKQQLLPTAPRDKIDCGKDNQKPADGYGYNAKCTGDPKGKLAN